MTNSPDPDTQAAERPEAEEAAAETEATTAEATAAEEAAAEDRPAAEDAPSDALRAELEALREKHDTTNDRLLRTAAELQNVRRRAAEEQRRRAVQARAAALRPLLDVRDDLQRALAAAEDDPAADSGEGESAFASLRNGVQMVDEKFGSALAAQGIEPIEAEGAPFDERFHEAMMQQPAPEGTAPGTVLAEIRRGYRMTTDSGDEDGSRVLRHSRVVVASEPAKEPSADGEKAAEDGSTGE